MARLVLVPTPIGNLGDITYRSVEHLKECDFVLAEDTRTSGFLLSHLGISKPLKSFHIHNEHKILSSMVEQIKQATMVCLVSDAGTPAISDPGFLLVRACIKEGIEVDCLPGPTALIPALVMSGLPADRFIYEGFLPLKKGRMTRIKSFYDEARTVVFYESPHRLEKTITQMMELLQPDRQLVVCRELTKKFQEVFRGTIVQAKEHFAKTPVKGEIVMVLGAYDEIESDDNQD